MNFWENLNIEYKVSLLLGGAGFLFSILIGLGFGVGPGTVLARSLFFMAAFGALGYGVVYLLKHYVPEIFSLMQSETTDEAPANESDGTRTGEYTGDEQSGAEASEGGFRELGDQDYERYRTGEADTVESDFVPSPAASMGKHIVVNEKTAKFEPKIMAQAIRTMLCKDD